MSKRNRDKSVPTGPRDSVQMSDGEFTDGLFRLYARLGRHLDALDGGELDAVDDVAAVLRILLCDGGANKVIHRAHRRLGIPIPEVVVTEEAWDKKGVVFAMGSMPVNSTNGVKNPQRLQITDWMKRRVLTLRGLASESITWGAFLNEYANTFGAHLQGNVHEALSRSSIAQSGNMPLGHYLVRAAGFAAESAMHPILEAADPTRASQALRPARAVLSQGGWLIGLALGQASTKPDDPSVDLDVVLGDVPEVTTLLTVPHGGLRYTMRMAPRNEHQEIVITHGWSKDS